MTPDTTPPAAPYGAPPAISQSEAARRCGVSAATIRRYRTSGKLADCRRDPSGTGWLIPIPSLVAAGLLDRVTPPDTPAQHSVERDATPPIAPTAAPPDSALHEEIEALRREVEGLRERLRDAQALAEDLRRAVERAEREADRHWMMLSRPLTAGRDEPGESVPDAHTAAPTSTVDKGRKTWWSRLMSR